MRFSYYIMEWWDLNGANLYELVLTRFRDFFSQYWFTLGSSTSFGRILNNTLRYFRYDLKRRSHFGPSTLAIWNLYRALSTWTTLLILDVWNLTIQSYSINYGSYMGLPKPAQINTILCRLLNRRTFPTLAPFLSNGLHASHLRCFWCLMIDVFNSVLLFPLQFGLTNLSAAISPTWLWSRTDFDRDVLRGLCLWY